MIATSVAAARRLIQQGVASDGTAPPGRIVRTPRIGVDYAGDWALRPWRFVVAGSPFASGPRIPLRAGRERSISSRE